MLSTGSYCASAVESEDLGVESECRCSTNLQPEGPYWTVICYTAAGLRSPWVNTDDIYLSRKKGLVGLSSDPTKLILSIPRWLIKNILKNIFVSGDWPTVSSVTFGPLVYSTLSNTNWTDASSGWAGLGNEHQHLLKLDTGSFCILQVPCWPFLCLTERSSL